MNHNVLAVEVVATQVVEAVVAAVTQAAEGEGEAVVIPAVVAAVADIRAAAEAAVAGVQAGQARATEPLRTPSPDRSFPRSLSRRRPTSKCSTNWPTELAASSS